MRYFLQESKFFEVHYSDLGFDEKTGKLVTSRCHVYLRGISNNDIKLQIQVVKHFLAIDKQQIMNYHRNYKEQKFFMYGSFFLQWSFYSVCVKELVSSTLIGIGSITAVTFLFIPHWTATAIMLPVSIMMYMCILGIVQWAGIPINAVSFVSIVMSIGLIVDYLMHILMKFYEIPSVVVKYAATTGERTIHK